MINHSELATHQFLHVTMKDYIGILLIVAELVDLFLCGLLLLLLVVFIVN